jgi:hypothetical protein
MDESPMYEVEEDDGVIFCFDAYRSYLQRPKLYMFRFILMSNKVISFFNFLKIKFLDIHCFSSSATVASSAYRAVVLRLF